MSGVGRVQIEQGESDVKCATYEAVGDGIVLLDDWRCHLRVDIVVVIYEVLIGHALLFLDEDGRLNHLSEASGVLVPGLESHRG